MTRSMGGITPGGPRTLRRFVGWACAALLCLTPPRGSADEPAPAATDTPPAVVADRDAQPAPAATPAQPRRGNRPPIKPRPGRVALPEEPATTIVFGVKGTGRRFVYVIDCSASMAHEGGRAIEAARKEVAESLDHLHKGNDFAILAYADTIDRWPNGTGVTGFAAWSSDELLRSKGFLRDLAPDGTATHAKAIDEALTMMPDVVFVITDSHVRHDITRKQLGALLDNARGAKIMVAHLASAAVQRCPNLAELAGKTGGRYEALSFDGREWVPGTVPTDAAVDRPSTEGRGTAAAESR